MNIKIKCVDDNNKYCFKSEFITKGRVYSGVIDKEKNFAIIDDDGYIIYDSITDSCYAKWELVNEE